MKKSRVALLYPLIALFLGTVMALLLAEIGVRLLAPQSLTSDVIEADPDLGFRLRPGARGRMVSPEFRADIRVNSLGFRGEEISLTKATRRVLMLGDSYTFGHGLDEKEALPGVVARELDRLHPGGFEVINGGVYGYCTANELELLRKYGMPLAPDVVVVVFSLNDIQDNAEWYELGEDGGLTKRPQISAYEDSRRITKHVPGAAVLREYSHLFKFVGVRVLPVLNAGDGPKAAPDQARTLNAGLPPGFFDDPRGPFRVSCALLGKTAEVVRRGGGMPILLTMGGHGSPHSVLMHEAFTREAAAQGYVAALALPAILATYKGPDRLYFPKDGHWTAAATAFVAPAVADVIVRVASSPGS